MTVVRIGNLKSVSILCMFQQNRNILLFTFTDNSFRVQSTTLKTDTSQWWIQGRGPGGPPPLILDQMRPEGPKKLFVEFGLLPYLRVWMTAPLPYLKVWIRHCTYIQTLSNITSIVFSFPCVDDICLSVIIRSYKQQVDGCFGCSGEFKCGKPKYSRCTFIVFSVDVILKRFSFKYFGHK